MVSVFISEQLGHGVSALDAHSELLHALLDHAEKTLTNAGADELYSQTALRYEDFYGPPAS